MRDVFPSVERGKKIESVIVITGTPGVGKTATSRLLAERLGALHLDLAKIVEDEGLTLGVDEERGSLIADFERLSERVQSLIEKSSVDVIVDGHYAPLIVSPELVKLAFVLRRQPHALEAELEARGFGGRKVKENVAAEVLDVCLWDAVNIYGLGKVHEIDVTGVTLDEVAEEISRVLEGRERPSVGKADWLSRLDTNGTLESFINWI